MHINSRVDWIDLYKGIGIFLVVIGHSNIPDFFSWWIWSFHMPMFFLISGYLFNPEKYQVFSVFFKGRLKSLVLPYISLTILCLISLFFLYKVDIFKISANSFVDYSIGVMFSGWGGIALWFIPVLFITEILVFYVIKYLSNTFFFLSIFAFSVSGYLLYVNEIKLPYKIDVVLTASVFYGIGFKIKSRIRSMSSLSLDTRTFAITFALLLLNILTCYLNTGRLDMAPNELNILYLTYLSAFSGIIFFILTSNILSLKLKDRSIVRVFLTYLGRNSLIILGVHQSLKLSLYLITPYFSNFILSTAIRHVVFWVLLFCIINFFNSHLYLLIGKKKSHEFR